MSDHPLRIGFISQWYDPEKGSAVTPGVQARALAALGHQVEVLTGWPHYPDGVIDPDFPRQGYVREQHGDIVVHRVPEYPTHKPNALARVANYVSFAGAAAIAAPRLLRDVDVTLVHSTPATAALPALVLKKVRRTPFVLHIQDLWPETVLASGFAGRSGRVMANVLHRFCDATYRQASSIAVTAPGMEVSIHRRGVPLGKLASAANWADESVFRPQPRDPALAAKLGLPGNGFIVMYAGNVGRIQGLSILLDAAHRLRNHSDIHFAIIGDGVAREELRTTACKSGLERIHFIDAQPFSQMGAVLALGDVQLISFVDKPLFRTTLPSKLQATLAAGRPILGAVAGDAAKVIRDSGAGRVVAPGDDAALAREVEAMAKDREATKKMGALGRGLYEREYSAMSSAQRLDNLLRAAHEGNNR